MKVISEEKWDEELWEIPEDAEEHRHRVPKFIFLFGKRDEWVASHIRDEFIESRKEHSNREVPPHKRGRTEIEVDEDGALPHAFCTAESKPFSCITSVRSHCANRALGSTVAVAEKINLWIEQIQESMQSLSNLDPGDGG